MRKRKLCVIWIWDLLYDNARFQRWLARHRRHGWELADVGFLFSALSAATARATAITCR